MYCFLTTFAKRRNKVRTILIDCIQCQILDMGVVAVTDRRSCNVVLHIAGPTRGQVLVLVAPTSFTTGQQ